MFVRHNVESIIKSVESGLIIFKPRSSRAWQYLSPILNRSNRADVVIRPIWKSVGAIKLVTRSISLSVELLWTGSRCWSARIAYKTGIRLDRRTLLTNLNWNIWITWRRAAGAMRAKSPELLNLWQFYTISNLPSRTLFSWVINFFPSLHVFNSLAVHLVTLDLLPLLPKFLSLSTAYLNSALIYYLRFNLHLLRILIAALTLQNFNNN